MIKIFNSQFYGFVTSGDGSVASINENSNIRVSTVVFNKCICTGALSRGGAICVTAKTGKSAFSNICAIQCIAHIGFAVYLDHGTTKSTFDEMSATRCNGSFKASFYICKTPSLFNNYNSSFVSAFYDSDIFNENVLSFESSFHNYYSDSLDAILVFFSDFPKAIASIRKSNFISNTKSNTYWGYVHINANEGVLNAMDLNFYNNTHFLFDCPTGTLYATRIMCDKYSYQTAHLPISITELTEDSKFEIHLDSLKIIKCEVRENICSKPKLYQKCFLGYPVSFQTLLFLHCSFEN